MDAKEILDDGVVIGEFKYYNWNRATSKYCKRINIKTKAVQVDELPAWQDNYWKEVKSEIEKL